MSEVSGEYLHLLNGYTKAVLEEALEVEPTLPEGYRLGVSAYSDVVLDHEASGHWVGLEMKGIDRERRRWIPWRGSAMGLADTRTWPTLAGAVSDIIGAMP